MNRETMIRETMIRETMIPTEHSTQRLDCRFQSDSTSMAEPLTPSVEPVDHPDSSHLFEDFLAEVEHCVQDAGQLLLFTGEHLRLEVMLLKHAKNPRVIWGLKRHEDWAFKATLLWFARGSEPVHLVLSTEHEGGYRLQGWVVKRSWDSFWASPLPSEQTNGFWERCLTPFSLEKLGASLVSDRPESAPHPEPAAEP